MNKTSKIINFPEVKKLDLQLNEHGEWLLVGAVACFSLPPILCIISAGIILWVGLVKYDSRLKELNQKILKKQIEGNPKRDKLIFTIGFCSITAAMFYGTGKMFLQSAAVFDYDWFLKNFWGNL